MESPQNGTRPGAGVTQSKLLETCGARGEERTEEQDADGGEKRQPGMPSEPARDRRRLGRGARVVIPVLDRPGNVKGPRDLRLVAGRNQQPPLTPRAWCSEQPLAAVSVSLW
jgi:hypothetical protein